jgi:hypothetical protein
MVKHFQNNFIIFKVNNLDSFLYSKGKMIELTVENQMISDHFEKEKC